MRAPLPHAVVQIMFALLLLPCSRGGAADGRLVVLPESHNRLTVLCDGEPYLDVGFVGWGKNWSWMGFQGELTERNRRTTMVNRASVGDAEITLTAQVSKTGDQQLELTTVLETTKDAELTYIVIDVTPAPNRFRGGHLIAESGQGKKRTVPIPMGRQEIGKNVNQIVVEDVMKKACRIGIAPACDVGADGGARIILASGTFTAQTPARHTLTLTFPSDFTYLAGSRDIPPEPGSQDWFPFTPDADHSAPSEISMSDWLEKPAGKHGRILRQGAQLIYNNRPIKLWGLNLCFSTCAPEKQLAEQRARFYAKYGVNAVRLHKYADGPGWSGIQSKDSFVEFDPEGLERMDYLVAKLKEQGIYVKLSAHFGSQKLGPADKRFVPFLEEFGTFDSRKNRVTTPHSGVHYCPELQELQIRQMVNLLKHRNPYTGLTYGADPVISFVEIINEQSILFFTSMTPLKTSPTIRRQAGRRFSAWLREKYGSHEQLVQQWGGKQALNSFSDDGFAGDDEHMDKGNILPLGNPWYWDPVQLNSSQAFRKQRLLDTMQFLYQLQNEFYARYVGAVRDAGYAGEIVSSNWQAGRALSHYYNLHSDALVGTVDRHNYFGGGDGNRIDNATMLSVPGSGILSAGMQQVADRPFMLSEWIHVTPNEWGVEGPAIIGAYGMGLQGWDVSYLFQNRDNGSFSKEIGRDRWDVTAPNVMGVFPAVSRQVLRGDVIQSDLEAPRYVNIDSFQERGLGFDDNVTQQYDVKTFQSDKVPAEALAVARCDVHFLNEYQATPSFDVKPFAKNGGLASSTSQLFWSPGSAKLDGFFTLNTPGTKGVVGFARDRSLELDNVTIESQSRYAAIYVTAKERDRDIATSNRLLVVAVARARNTGMKVFNDDRIIERGSPPVLLEPVKAKITISGRGTPRVTRLDHNGRLTNNTIPVAGETFTIDGARDKTCYYLVSYDKSAE